MTVPESRKEAHAQAEFAQAAFDRQSTQPPRNSGNQKRINSQSVRHLCGDISDMTLWRWLQQRKFPAAIYIGKRRYWKEAEVIAWLEQQETQIPAE